MQIELLKCEVLKKEASESEAQQKVVILENFLKKHRKTVKYLNKQIIKVVQMKELNTTFSESLQDKNSSTALAKLNTKMLGSNIKQDCDQVQHNFTPCLNTGEENILPLDQKEHIYPRAHYNQECTVELEHTLPATEPGHEYIHVGEHLGKKHLLTLQQDYQRKEEWNGILTHQHGKHNT